MSMWIILVFLALLQFSPQTIISNFIIILTFVLPTSFFCLYHLYFCHLYIIIYFNTSYNNCFLCKWNTYSSHVVPPQLLPSRLLSSWYVASGRCDLWPVVSKPTADLSREFQAAIPTGHECSRLWQTGMIRVARQHVPNHHAAKSCSTIQGHTRKKAPSPDWVCSFCPVEPLTSHIQYVPYTLKILSHSEVIHKEYVLFFSYYFKETKKKGYAVFSHAGEKVKTLRSPERKILLSVSLIAWLVNRAYWQR